MGALLQVQVPP